MAKCNLCGMPIMWARTRAGKSVALAMPPVANGNIWLEDGPVNPTTGRPKPIAAHESKEHPMPENVRRRYRDHHLSCRVYQAKKAMEALLR